MTDQVISDDDTGRKGSCATCRFADMFPAVGGHTQTVACRRYPPSLVNIDNGRSYRAVFPQFSAGEWCGEYQPSGAARG